MHRLEIYPIAVASVKYTQGANFYSPARHSDIRIKDCATHYEYCCVYVDDVIFVTNDPMNYIRMMEYEYQLKGVGVPEYYFRWQHGARLG